MSYLGAAACIISTAQHARPNVIGQREPFLAQLTRSSSLVTVKSTALSNLPREAGAGVEVGVAEGVGAVCWLRIGTTR